MPRRANAPILSAGLDLDSTIARLAILSRDGDTFTIEALHDTGLDPDWFDEGTPRDTKAISAALRELVKAAGLKPSTPLHGSAANEPTIIRLITPPPVPTTQLQTVLQYEIRKVLPVSEEDAEIRHEVIEGQDGTRVLVGAVRRNHVTALSSVYSATRTRYAGLEPRPLSAMRSTAAPSDLPDILVIANTTSSSITARTNNVLVANRVSDVGSSHLDAEPEEAARALIADMSDIAHTITNAIAPDFTITLIGAALESDAFRSALTNHFDREPSTITPASAIAAAVTPDTNSAYLPAIGLALRGFTPSAPIDFRTQRRVRRTRGGARTFAPYLLAPAIAVAAFGYHTYLESTNARLQDEIHAYQQQGREYDEITARYNELLMRQNRITSTLNTVRHLTTTTVPYSSVVDRLIPRTTQVRDGTARAYVRTLEINQHNPPPIRDNADPPLDGSRFGVTIAGTTRGAATIADIIRSFENDSTIEALFDRARSERANEFDYDMRLTMIIDPPHAATPTPQTTAEPLPPDTPTPDTPEQPTTDPTPEPTPEPAPEPTPDPQPAPEPQPTHEPPPDPTPEPAPQTIAPDTDQPAPDAHPQQQLDPIPLRPPRGLPTPTADPE